MSYDGKINRKLRTVELNDDDECLYKLAYDEEKRSCFKQEDILKYVNERYLENDNINDNINDNNIEENLLNDLNTFKTYRDDVDTIVRKQSDFGQFLTILLAMLSVIVNVELKPDSKLPLVVISLIIVIASFIYYWCCTGSKSESAKLKFITNAIYTLETIKEDKYRNGNWCTKSNEIISSVNDKLDDGNLGTESDEIISSVNDKLDDGNTEDIATEDADERYEGLELAEVREIRTYKATKNKYSPRAMYERKRR